ncbi:MAG: chemotaxis protein [Desulfovibrionaceae bacterium]
MSQNNILLETGTNELEIIEFYINEELPDGRRYCGYYGMNVAKVLEIIRRPTITNVPSKHDKAVLGTFNLRGRVLPLVDLAKWLGKTMVSEDAHKVIVSEFSGIVTAFLVSGVTRIHRMSWNDIEAPGKHVHSYSQESITGVVRIDERILFILDMEKIVGSMDSTYCLALQLSEGSQPVEDASHFHILIADDSSSLRNTIKYTLGSAGYKVTATASGKEAWEYIEKTRLEAEAAGEHFTDRVQLLISDIEMPEMDGHNLTRKIRASPALSNLPVILFSSLITDALRHKGIAVGADDQVTKPDLPSLTQKVRSLIAEKLHR